MTQLLNAPVLEFSSGWQAAGRVPCKYGRCVKETQGCAVQLPKIPLPAKEAVEAIRGQGNRGGAKGAPTGGGREILVDARLEVDVMFLQQLRRQGQLLVEAAKRAATVAGNVATGVVALGRVAPPLHQRQAYQRLGAGKKNAALVQSVLVRERYVPQDHDKRSPSVLRPIGNRD